MVHLRSGLGSQAFTLTTWSSTCRRCTSRGCSCPAAGDGPASEMLPRQRRRSCDRKVKLEGSQIKAHMPQRVASQGLRHALPECHSRTLQVTPASTPKHRGSPALRGAVIPPTLPASGRRKQRAGRVPPAAHCVGSRSRKPWCAKCGAMLPLGA